MSKVQKTLSIPRWLTNGPGWQTSNQGSCRVTVTRNYGDSTAKIETYWGYCSPGGSQASVNCIINVNGTVKNQQLFGPTVHSAGVWYYANGTSFTVPVSDSAGSLNISVYMIVNAGTSGKQSSTVSGSFSYDSRGETTPSVSKTSADIGTAVTITTKPYSSGFSHKLYYSTDGGKTKTSIGTVAAGTTTTSWTIPTSIASKIPNDTSILITIVCETYNGSSRVGGNKTCTLTATVPASYKPSISSVTISEATAGLASQFGVYVQTKSKLKVVTSASGSNGSTIKSITVSCDGFKYSGSTITTSVINASGSVSVSVTVTDSRGRTTSTSKTVSVVAYSPPAITTATVTRATSAGTASDNGTYSLCQYAYSITNVNNKNTHTFKIQYKSGSSWVDLVTYTDYAKSGKYISSKTFDVNTSFEFRFLVTDYFGSYPIERSMDVSFTLVNYGADGHSMMIGGQAADKPGFFATKIPFAPLQGQCLNEVRGTDGSAGYINVLRIGITKNYSNTPLKFTFCRRNDYITTDCWICFNNKDNVDPELKSFITHGVRDVWIKKAATSTWDVYIKKSEAYDSISITDIQGNLIYNKKTITLRNVFAASLPSDCTQAKDIKLYDGTYPVGHVITTTDATNPSTLYGGTWEAFAPGRVLVGAGTGNDGSTSMTLTTGSTGGKFKETLTISQIPAHDHVLDRSYQSSTGAHKHQGTGGVADGVNPYQGKNTYTTYKTGGGEAHNNMPPYYVIYRWRRTG